MEKARIGKRDFDALSNEIKVRIDDELKKLSFDASNKGEKVSKLIGCEDRISILNETIVESYDNILGGSCLQIKKNKIVDCWIKGADISQLLLFDFRELESFQKDAQKYFKKIDSDANALRKKIELLLEDARNFEVAMAELGSGFLEWAEPEAKNDELHQFGLSYELDGVDELSSDAIKIASDYLNEKREAIQSSILEKVLCVEEEREDGLSLTKDFASHRKNLLKLGRAPRKGNSLMVQRLANTIVYFYGNIAKFYFKN